MLLKPAPSARPVSLGGKENEFCSTGQPAGGLHAFTSRGVGESHPKERVLGSGEGAPCFSQNLELVVGVLGVVSLYPRKCDFFLCKIMAGSSELYSTSCSRLLWNIGFEASPLHFLFLAFIFCFRFGLSNSLTFQI